ncbi:MAG: zf-HC2 domain-containing protein [Candidatus Eremiobacteraeota bacterium]|nr:zf-HC2 domain-containing protein [Candidatus Eremiobacteraeota bacterium]
MSCSPFHELLTGALDGELDAEETARLELHLAECSACRALKTRLERLDAGFSHLPQAAPPPLRPRAVVTPLPEKTGSAPAATAIWSVLLAAAACAAMTFWNPQAVGGSELYLSSNQLAHQSPPAGESPALNEFRSAPLHGKLMAQAELHFEIHLDSDSHPCKDLQLQVDYDFDGDGRVDRSETYASFDTDGKDGWEVYTQGRGALSHQGAMRDFTGGTVSCHLKNASGEVQYLQGNSKLILPHRLGV